MCVSCGCGRPNDNHGDQRNITIQDIDAAAQAANTTRSDVVQNIANATQNQQGGAFGQNINDQAGSYSQSQSGSGLRRDGYGDMQTGDYNQGQSVSQGQEGYDPGHSGVRHAQNQPGKRVDTPGEDSGTAWGENLQMGKTTDTPDQARPDH